MKTAKVVPIPACMLAMYRTMAVEKPICIPVTCDRGEGAILLSFRHCLSKF